MTDDDDVPLGEEADPSGRSATAVRHRASSHGEAWNVAAWGLAGVGFVVLFLRLGIDLWTGTRGLLFLGGLVLLSVLFSVHRARTRTVHPRHFNFAVGVAGLWLAVGASVTGQVLGVFEGAEVAAGVAVLAALVLSAPMFGCAVWLAVRGR